MRHALEFRAHPGSEYPVGRRLRARTRRWCAWPATSRPIRRCPRCARRSSARWSTLNRYPDPSNSLLRARAERALRRPAGAHRDRQRLVRHPARRRRGAARAGRRARLRVAVVLGLPAPRAPPRARARSRCRSTTTHRHDLDGDAARDHRRHAPGDRLQPEQPDQHGAAARARSPSSSTRCRAHVCVIVDEAYCEFNLLEDPDASLDLLDAPPQPGAAADVLEGLRPVRAARRLRAVRLARRFRARSTRCASRSSATRSRRRRRSRRSRHQDAVIDRVERNVAERISVDERLRALGIEPADVAGQLLLVRARRGARRARSSCAACAERGVLVRAGDGARAARARCASPTARPRRTNASCDALAEARCEGATTLRRSTMQPPHDRTERLQLPRRAPVCWSYHATPGDLARRFGLAPYVSGPRAASGPVAGD